MSNIGPIPEHKIEQARAALQLIESFERGTAVVAIPDGHGSAYLRGGVCYYRSMAGDVYQATVTRYWSNDLALADIDVHLPNVHDPVHLRGIRIKQHGEKD